MDCLCCVQNRSMVSFTYFDLFIQYLLCISVGFCVCVVFTHAFYAMVVIFFILNIFRFPLSLQLRYVDGCVESVDFRCRVWGRYTFSISHVNGCWIVSGYELSMWHTSSSSRTRTRLTIHRWLLTVSGNSVIDVYLPLYTWECENKNKKYGNKHDCSWSIIPEIYEWCSLCVVVDSISVIFPSRRHLQPHNSSV